MTPTYLPQGWRSATWGPASGVRVIDRFVGRYRVFSNFHFSPIEVEGVLYPTVEHAFQAVKTHDPDVRLRIAGATSPGAAKILGGPPSRGGIVNLRSDWEEVKTGVMHDLQRQKFANPLFADLLLATDDAVLIEGNYHRDREWGAVWDGNAWVGKNLLGRLLMIVRAEIQQSRADAVGR